MHDSALNDVASKLQEEEARLVAEFSELKQQADAIDEGIRRIKKAISALTITKERKASKRTDTQVKPAPSRADVAHAVTQALSTGVAVSEAELKERVVSLLTEQGKSQMGLALRLREVLQEPRFTSTDSGYRLASAPKPAKSQM